MHDGFRNRSESTRLPRAGFTLIELMAVIAIIGILAGIILGISGYVSRKADMARVQGDLEQIKTALEEYKIINGKYYPNNCGANDATFSAAMAAAVNKNVSELRWTDPWTKPYNYSFIGNNQFRLWSNGPDGTSGTVDDIESTRAAF